MGCRWLSTIWRKELHENFDVRLVSELLNEGFDADSVIAEGLAGSPDETIYETCKAVSRTLVTLDLDFSSPLRFPPEHSEGIVVARPPKAVLSSIRATHRLTGTRSCSTVDSGPPFD